MNKSLQRNTEGIKYAGSKLKLIPHILEMIPNDCRVVFDGFSGTTRVSQAFAKSGYQVISNDISVWSSVFASCYLQAKEEPSYYQEQVDYLNSLPGVDGWFTENYGSLEKKPFQIHNLRKLDAIRKEIDCFVKDKPVLLTSLILALDKVDNTLGHFSSYLREYSARSYNDLRLTVPNIIKTNKKHKVYQADTIELAKGICADLAYYDPPYGSGNDKMPSSRVRYNSYYHFWTTVCLNDRPELYGKTGRRVDSSDNYSSVFEEFRKNGNKLKALEAVERLIKNTKTKYILFSYSSTGRIPLQELREVLGDIVQKKVIDYKKNVMAEMKWTDEWTQNQKNQELIFLIDNH